MSRKTKAAEFQDVGYDIYVTGRNVQVTDGMKAYVIEKISKVERFSDRVIIVNVIMDIQKLEHRVDIILRLNNAKIKSSAATDNMYASIDKAVDRLREQIRRYKTRIQDHQSIRHEDVAMNVNVYTPSDEVTQYNEEIEDENQRSLLNRFSHNVVKKETRPMKTLNASEAIVKMELSGDAFMIYRSEEDRKIKVIYRRDDGNFGIIEAES